MAHGLHCQCVEVSECHRGLEEDRGLPDDVERKKAIARQAFDPDQGNEERQSGLHKEGKAGEP